VNFFSLFTSCHFSFTHLSSDSQLRLSHWGASRDVLHIFLEFRTPFNLIVRFFSLIVDSIHSKDALPFLLPKLLTFHRHCDAPIPIGRFLCSALSLCSIIPSLLSWLQHFTDLVVSVNSLFHPVPSYCSTSIKRRWFPEEASSLWNPTNWFFILFRSPMSTFTRISRIIHKFHRKKFFNWYWIRLWNWNFNSFESITFSYVFTIWIASRLGC
jgi:hypothetical protein